MRSAVGVVNGSARAVADHDSLLCANAFDESDIDCSNNRCVEIPVPPTV